MLRFVLLVLVAMTLVACEASPLTSGADADTDGGEVALSSLPPQTDAPLAVPTDARVLTVQRVVDGDTFYAEELDESVRLWGIDAPERGDVPAGPDATSFLRRLVEQSDRRLFCVPKDVDRYGRHVARCYTPDGQDLQWGMIYAGHALEWCRYSKNAYEECGKPGGRAKR